MKLLLFIAALATALFISPSQAQHRESSSVWRLKATIQGQRDWTWRSFRFDTAAKGQYKAMQSRSRLSVDKAMLNASEYSKLPPQARYIPVPMMRFYDNGLTF